MIIKTNTNPIPKKLDRNNVLYKFTFPLRYNSVEPSDNSEKYKYIEMTSTTLKNQ